MKVLILLFSFNIYAQGFQQQCSDNIPTTNNDTVFDTPLNILSLGLWSHLRSAPQNSPEMLNAAGICRWQEQSINQCVDCDEDEKPKWEEDYEVSYARTGLVRGFRMVGAGAARTIDAYDGYTPARMEEINNELPNEIIRLSSSFPEFPQCAEKLEYIANNCSHGKYDLTSWRASLACLSSRQYPTLDSCLEEKCPIEMDENLKRKCRAIIPFGENTNNSVIKHNSLLTGLYIIKNEDDSKALEGETSSMRTVRRTVNLVQDYLSPYDEFPERVDRVMDAFERGGTNCYGYANAIKSALSFTGIGKGIESAVVLMSTPAHAWNRIRLQEPPMEFDIDGVSYDTSGPNNKYAMHEFYPLPSRGMVERPHCPSVLANQCENNSFASSRNDDVGKTRNQGESSTSTQSSTQVISD